MTVPSVVGHDAIVDQLFEQYSREGYAVRKGSGSNTVPFDLNGYSPDLVAEKGDEHLIVEVSTGTRNVSFDRLRSVSEEVKRHPGWKFYLVTGEDVDPDLPGIAPETFSWDEVSYALEQAASLKQDLAFMQLWVAFEKMTRNQARSIALPVDRLASPKSMLGPLYSHGEFSWEQYQSALELLRTRNRLFHGLHVSGLDEAVQRLAALVRELRQEWTEPVTTG